MAIYVGVNGAARKVKKKYVGVGGVARNVKAQYVGVNGVARKVFGDDSGEVPGGDDRDYKNVFSVSSEEFPKNRSESFSKSYESKTFVLRDGDVINVAVSYAVHSDEVSSYGAYDYYTLDGDYNVKVNGFTVSESCTYDSQDSDSSVFGKTQTFTVSGSPAGQYVNLSIYGSSVTGTVYLTAGGSKTIRGTIQSMTASLSINGVVVYSLD